MPRFHPFVILFVAATAFPGLVNAQNLTTEEQQLIDLVNAARAQAGMSPLEIDLRLAAVARSHSLDMARNRFFSHSSPTTGEMSDRLNTAGVPFRRAGENIALDLSVAHAHNSFMESPQHRANVLNPEFTHVGVGIVRLGERVMVTQAFMLPPPPPPQPPVPGNAAPQTEIAGDATTQDRLAPHDGRTAAELQGSSVGANLTSPFERDTPAPAPDAPEARLEGPAPTQSEAEESPSAPPSPAPGIWVVTRDGQWHQLDLSPDILLRMLSSM